MTGEDDGRDAKPARESLAETVGSKARRKLRARRSTQGVWYGLGTIGLIGWSIAAPTLVGAAIGLWLDRSGAGHRGWTLALMAAGLTIGCFAAWRWIAEEDRSMHEEDPDEPN